MSRSAVAERVSNVERVDPEVARELRETWERENRECLELCAIIAAGPLLLAAMPLLLLGAAVAEAVAWARRRASAAHGTEEVRHA